MVTTTLALVIPELLHHILRHLDDLADLLHCCETCKAWRRAGGDAVLWQELHERLLGPASLNDAKLR
jgi:F-box-like